MRKLLSLPVMAFFAVMVLPVVLAVSIGSGVDVEIDTEDFEPRVWMCDSRAVLDDNTEPGRLPGDMDQIIKDYLRKQKK